MNEVTITQTIPPELEILNEYSIKKILCEQSNNNTSTASNELLTIKKRVKSTQKNSPKKRRKKFQFRKYKKLIIHIIEILILIKDVVGLILFLFPHDTIQHPPNYPIQFLYFLLQVAQLFMAKSVHFIRITKTTI